MFRFLAIVLLTGLASGVHAQIPRIGILFDDAVSSKPLREGLRELGYVEGRNIEFHERDAKARNDRWPDLAGDLVRLNVHVIVARNTPATVAAKQATTAIPIVMAGTGDPVGAGLVASLARPGGNVTGVAFLGAGLAAKRLEILKEAIPDLERVAVYWNPTNPAQIAYPREAEAAAKALGVKLDWIEVRGARDLDASFAATGRQSRTALLVTGDPVVQHHVHKLVALAAKMRVPAMYNARENVEAGGLMSYGASRAAVARRAASYVDRILKGARPADLPVEQPATFEFVVNQRTAKALGMTIPRTLLLRADHLIE